MTPTIRPSIASDFDKFTDRPIPYRVRSWTGVLDGEVIAVGGIANLPTGGHAVFLMADDKARGFPIALHKAGLMVLKEVKRLGIRRLVTNKDSHIEAAERWLVRLGFRPLDEEKETWEWVSS